MKAILMAAGMGTRISQKTSKPKSLLKVGEESIILHTVKMLQSHGIDVSIIVGFKDEYIREELKDVNVKFYYNPFYRVTNSIASLWFAKNELDGNDTIILGNADVYWDEDVLEELVKSEKDVVMLADKTRVEKGDYFLNVKTIK